MKNESIVDLIALIQRRPTMYIGWADILCLKSYLDGWCQRDITLVTDIEVMSKFQDWIEHQYRIKTAHSWAHILLFFSSGNSNALDLFFIEFERFLKEERSRNL